MTAFNTGWYLLNRLYISLNYYWLLSLSCNASWIIITACASWRNIVFHELFLKLCLLLSLPSYLLLAEVLIAIVSVSVEVNGGPLPGEHVALLRWRHHHLLGRVLYYNLRHMLREGRCLLVGVQGRVTT